MSDSFQDADPIILQPGSSLTRTFTFAACTSATANDGSIPYGTTVSTVDITAFDESGTDVTVQIVVSESNTSLVETIKLKYPATSGTGRYSIEMIVTLDSGDVMEFDFTKLYALDIRAAR